MEDEYEASPNWVLGCCCWRSEGMNFPIFGECYVLYISLLDLVVRLLPHLVMNVVFRILILTGSVVVGCSKRVVSAVQSTGSIHPRNYLSAIKNWIILQIAVFPYFKRVFGSLIFILFIRFINVCGFIEIPAQFES